MEIKKKQPEEQKNQGVVTEQHFLKETHPDLPNQDKNALLCAPTSDHTTPCRVPPHYTSTAYLSATRIDY